MSTRAYWLMGIEGRAIGIRTPITDAVLVGRGAYNHIVLKDSRVSRQHARISLERDGAYVYDLNSSNGTFVNGARITRHKLQLNDEVSFDLFTFRVTAGSQEMRLDDEKFTDREVPTRRDLASVRSMQAVQPISSSSIPTSSSRLPTSAVAPFSSPQLPVVDLRQLEDAHEKLGMLYGFIQHIGQTIEKDKLLKRVLDEIRDVFEVSESVAIFLPASAPGTFELANYVGQAMNAPSLPDDVGKRLVDTLRPMLTTPRKGRTSGGTKMFAPLVHRNEAIAIVHVDGGPMTSFLQADLDLLAGMAAPAAMMLNVAQHHDELLRRDRHAYDLELAVQIQKGFLPREVIAVEGFELVAEYKAAFQVGGDFYDVFWVEPNKRLGVFIGDIAGKGISGALHMARISSEMRAAALQHVEPIAVMNAMNEAVLSRNQPDFFFTAIYLTLDVKTGDLLLANAGHPSPYLLRNSGLVEEITEGSAMPVGIIEGAEFASTTLHLNDGESLVLFTDGVIEATDAAGELYGNDRLVKAITGGKPRPLELAERILTSVNQHSAEHVSDDLTLFIVERNTSQPPSLQPRRRSTRMGQVRP